MRGRIREGIPYKEQKDVLVACEEMFFGANDDRIRTPGTEGGEPQVPVEARLVRRVNAGCLGGALRLKAKRIDQPSLTIGGALELNLRTAAAHYTEKAITIGDTERF